MPRLLIAGTHSGVGKTSVAVGVMAALRRAGWEVSPFKVGPDYIDPGYHRAAAGRDSWCLDSWMLGLDGVADSLRRGAKAGGQESIAVIEGMMGLHDGADPLDARGSTAEIARRLDCPVILVIDGSAVARSAGALVQGYRDFDPGVRLAGVLANRVAGEGHAAFLRPSIESLGVPFLGWLPERPDLALPERHLGLVMSFERPDLAPLVDRLADWVGQGVDLGKLAAIARAAGPAPAVARVRIRRRAKPDPLARVAVARDEAFCFYYPENLAILEEAGAEIVPFSPIRDKGLPKNVHGLYLGGGYPELYAAALSDNRKCRAEIAAAIQDGLPTFAECGGWMYLCQALVTADGCSYEMAGVVPGMVRMAERLQAIGYREATLCRDSVLGAAGTCARGHEFHYSWFDGEIPAADAAFEVGGGRTGYSSPSLVASYIHLHFGSNPALAAHFVQQCAQRR